MNLIFLLLTALEATLIEYLHKHEDDLEKFKKEYRENILHYQREKSTGDPTVLLIWWGPEYPLLRKIEPECGECWITHEKHLEKEAAGSGFNLFFECCKMCYDYKPRKAIIFDNTRYVFALHGKLHQQFEQLTMPDFENRNTETQYWVWWPRETAAKGQENGLNYDLVVKSGWDSAFNLTASYRRDSDVQRIWGTPQVS